MVNGRLNVLICFCFRSTEPETSFFRICVTIFSGTIISFSYFSSSCTDGRTRTYTALRPPESKSSAYTFRHVGLSFKIIKRMLLLPNWLILELYRGLLNTVKPFIGFLLMFLFYAGAYRRDCAGDHCSIVEKSCKRYKIGNYVHRINEIDKCCY